MKIDNIDVDSAIASVKNLLEKERDLSPSLKAALEVLLVLVALLLNRTTLNSKNSSKPPSTDPNRDKSSKKGSSNRKPGGQKGRIGTTLQQVDDPDAVKELKVDRRSLPKGRRYQEDGYETRQVIDIDILRFVTEYRAQVIKDDQGNRFVAAFPDRVSRSVQYGIGIKANAVYMSQFQLLPYDRIRDHFQEQMGIPVSAGSVFNFNKEAYEKLDHFEQWAKAQLAKSELMHVDETGINLNGKRHWLHCASNSALTLLYPHTKRGTEAMDEMGVLPFFSGVLCHDHWKPYYRYACTHSLCNAHHLRELERAWEQDDQHWAKAMKVLLIDMNTTVADAGGRLPATDAERWRQRYRQVLEEADSECPPPDVSLREAGKRGRLKRSKARNLLERLRNFEHDVLRFMDVEYVPFTNNQGENDLRMTKVQQKISGCFRSMAGAKIFCRVRSYLSTCRKQGMSATEALALLFQGKDPAFMDTDETQF
ncbi:IS66 family transposase [Marinobacter sp. LV10MA510-1]|uniref:IS66 family transposase n=1 Tax=Marinobacter sp. LV10MA510-1 TaxID=1415567 RepID=UPI000BF98ADE|nr:IS66 family transposase [Marinobacter sp. LV10MA510-1]PFG11828.1 transposase [Marinobacter sp. LV10MA510-1]